MNDKTTDEELGRQIWFGRRDNITDRKFYEKLGHAARAALSKSRIEGMSEEEIRQEMRKAVAQSNHVNGYLDLCARVAHRLAHEPAEDPDREAKRINGIITVGINKDGDVYMDFGRLVDRVSMSASDARFLAQTLIALADNTKAFSNWNYKRED